MTETLCRICGSRAAGDGSDAGNLLCAVHKAEYFVARCQTCRGVHIGRHGQDTACSFCRARTQFAALPEPLRAKIDALLLAAPGDGQSGHAIRALQAEMLPRPSLSQTTEILAIRSREIRPKVARPPPPEIDVASLSSELRPLTPVAIEARWDGDTNGWFIDLEAIIPVPSRDHPKYTARHLYTLSNGSDIRIFQGAVPPWPEAQRAVAVGEQLSKLLGVPFHFLSRDEPDDDADRWWSGSAAK